MSGQTYVILGYVVGLGLLWGYALSLWLAARSARRTPAGRGSGDLRDSSSSPGGEA